MFLRVRRCSKIFNLAKEQLEITVDAKNNSGKRRKKKQIPEKHVHASKRIEHDYVSIHAAKLRFERPGAMNHDDSPTHIEPQYT